MDRSNCVFKDHPQPVLGVQIPKPDGGQRQLGIPTVVDRLVQQDPGRSAHWAVQ